MADQSMDALTEKVEKELLDEIIKNLDQNTMTEEEARQLAREFLALLPIQDQQDLLNKLYEISQKHEQAKGIYLNYAKPLEEDDRQKKLALMSEHIKNGQIEHALSVAKGGMLNA